MKHISNQLSCKHNDNKSAADSEQYFVFEDSQFLEKL